MPAQIPITPEQAALIQERRAALLEVDPEFRRLIETHTKREHHDFAEMERDYVDFIHKCPESRDALVKLFKRLSCKPLSAPSEAELKAEQQRQAADLALTERFRNALIRVSDPDNEQFEPPILRLNSQPILYYQSLLGVIGNIGTGKSHFAEMLASRYLTGTVLENGIQGDPANRDVLYFDIERGRRHLKTRTVNRTRQHLQSGALFQRFAVLDGVDWLPEELIEFLEKGMQELPETGLVVIDPLTSAVRSPNDDEESNRLVRELKAFAKRHNVALITAIHGNRNDATGKAKGHLGDAVQREAVSFLRVQEDGKDPSRRYLTANFENGKTREGDKSKASTGGKWSDAKMCYEEVATALADVDGNIRQEMLTCYNAAKSMGKAEEQFTQKAFVELYQASRASSVRSVNTIRERIADAVFHRFLREIPQHSRLIYYSFNADALLNEN